SYPPRFDRGRRGIREIYGTWYHPAEISTIIFVHLPFYGKRERNLMISHSSQLVFAGKTDYQYPRKEIQSPLAEPRAITNTPQKPHFYLFFSLTLSIRSRPARELGVERLAMRCP